jgi:hypothetical protein
VKQRLILLNAVLAVLAGFAAWNLYRGWKEARAREEALRAAELPRRDVVPPPSVPVVQPVAATGFEKVATQMLFARDRNPAVIIEAPAAPPPEPMPPLPLLFGMMVFGDDISILLAETPAGAQKSYRQGDEVGAFRIVALSRDTVRFRWKDKEIEKPLAELKPTPEQRAAAGSEGRGPAPGAGSVADLGGARGADAAQQLARQQQEEEARKASSNSANRGTPGADVGNGMRLCAPGDDSPSGTVSGGFRKVISTSPFGRSCRWEPIR